MDLYKENGRFIKELNVNSWEKKETSDNWKALYKMLEPQILLV